MSNPSCIKGCGPIAVPILAMNRGHEQKSMHPTHTLGCPACGETWEGSKTATASAGREERNWERRSEDKRKAGILRERLAAAPKATPVRDEP